ncbi:hypothetical protein A3715_00285 [Oleiphilus sp. HI0009]|nr:MULTISPECIES: SCO family protein [unclassified Oleiphilus]KZX82232.1 hypothetical protein A3715_00285 [Oleiphilus sp. HI0009]KZY61760.1 hypothetical protein A3738_02890 [Oleiphilus sp. HI0066]KZY70746.1 hypothetical protein A3739_06195 [Oleiphilus sp. HI0067]
MSKAQGIVFSLSLIIVGVLSFKLYQQSAQKEPEDVKAAYLTAGDFMLESGGETFSSKTLRGQPYILYFGFTSCPDVCPLGLTVIRDALNSSDQLNDIPAVFVSVDPERDTSEVLGSYVSFFHPNIIPVRGDLVATQELAKRYGTYFIKAPLSTGASDDPTQYTIDHTAYYFVVDGQGKLVRVLEHNAKPEELSQALLKLLS